MNIVLNEKAYAEQALQANDLGNSPFETISRVARYYYGNGYKKKEISGLIEDFILRCDPRFNLVRWQNMIDLSVAISDKYPLINIDGVNITEAEIKRVKQLEGVIRQRLMFTLLCLAKYGNSVNPMNNNWVNQADKDVFAIANIKTTRKRQSLLINDLWNSEYIGYSKVVDNTNLNVKIINEDSPTALFISDFRNLGNQYRQYCGEDYIKCQCCDLVIRRKSNVHKYCSECAADMNRKLTFANWQQDEFLSKNQ